MRHEFTREELAEIEQRYPKLKQDVFGPFETWEGIINFNKSYREDPIVDSFEIKIIFPDNYQNQKQEAKKAINFANYNIPREF